MAAIPPMVEARLRADAAITEALEQLAAGWTPREVAAVLADAARVIDDLREVALR